MLRRNILLLHNAALGDFVLTWPLAIALGRTAAQSRVFYVTGADKGALVQKAISIETSDIEAGWHHLHGDIGKLDGEAKKLLGGALTIIAFAQNPDAEMVARLTAASGGAKVIQVIPNPPAGVHVWDHQAAQFDAYPPIGQYLRAMQDVVRQRGLSASPPTHPNRVVIHPGSGSAAKNWPIERFVEVASKLKHAGREVWVVLGEVELEKFPADGIEALKKVSNLRELRTLPELFDLLQSAGAYIGNDSGPTHLAAMLGRPTVALFGPASDVASWSPQGPKVKVLPFEATADEVVAATVEK